MSKRSRKPWTARRIHLWVAIIVGIPMLLMAITGVLIAMRTITKVQVPMSWMAAETIPDRLPMTAYTESADGVRWIGNDQGLWKVTPAGVEQVPAFAGQEIVALAYVAGQSSPAVATNMAIWHEADGQWTAVARGRVRQLANLGDGRVVAIAGGRGTMANGRAQTSTDGINWQPYGKAMQANKSLPAITEPKVSLQQWMREIHSGAYFIGKGRGEIIWGNIFGWMLGLLAITGIWMWWRAQRREAEQPQKVVAPRQRTNELPSAASKTAPEVL